MNPPCNKEWCISCGSMDIQNIQNTESGKKCSVCLCDTILAKCQNFDIHCQNFTHTGAEWCDTCTTRHEAKSKPTCKNFDKGCMNFTRDDVEWCDTCEPCHKALLESPTKTCDKCGSKHLITLVERNANRCATCGSYELDRHNHCDGCRFRRRLGMEMANMQLFESGQDPLQICCGEKECE